MFNKFKVIPEEMLKEFRIKTNTGKFLDLDTYLKTKIVEVLKEILKEE